MDVRKTLSENEIFLELLQGLFHSRRKVSLLVDNHGITRAEGFITAIQPLAAPPFIELDNALTIPVNTIIAVNGTFLPDYSEC